LRTNWKQLVLIALFICSLVPALAQSAAVDPALLSKASAGDAAAQVQVGEGYAAGSGQARTAKQAVDDYRQAVEWYLKAAVQGDIAGEIHLAALYRDGKGVARDMVQAAGWYRKAAEQGDATAQATLGVLYSIGQGVEHNDVEAYFWLDLSAAVKGPNQEKYAANRQIIGTHITADELEAVQERVAQWKSAHPR
jgi:TPR repeat protein